MTNEWLQTYSNMYAFFMLFAYPLTIRNSYFDITDSKLVFFYTASLLFIVATLFQRLICAIKGTDMGLKKSTLPEIIITSIMAASFLLTFLINGSYKLKLLATGEPHMSIAFLGICIISFVLLRQTPPDKTIFAVSAIVGSAGVGILAALQFFGYDPGNFRAIASIDGPMTTAIMSTMSNKDLIGFYFTAMLPFGFYLATTKKWYLMTIGALGCAFTEIGIIVCDTDAAIACFGAELILLVIFCAQHDGFKVGYPICLATMGIGHIIIGYLKLNATETMSLSYICTLIIHPYVGLFLLVAGLIFFVLMMFVNHKIVKGLAIIAFLFVLAYPLVVYYYTTHRAEISSADSLPFDSFLLFGESYGSGRGFLWMITVGIFKESPILEKIFGMGAQEYPLRYINFCQTHEHFASRVKFPYYDAHDMYLQFLVEYGIIGLLSGLTFVVYRTVSMLRTQSDDCFYKIKGVVFITAMISAVWLFCSNISMAFLPLLL